MWQFNFLFNIYLYIVVLGLINLLHNFVKYSIGPTCQTSYENKELKT